MAESMTKGGEGGSAAAVPAQMAMGFGLAQEMMKNMQTPPPLPGAAAAPAHGATPGSALPIPELMSPAQAAQVLGVTEADVIASLDAGELKGKKIGSAWRITKTALDAFLAE
jgi:excisionase family DNA binding protein